MTRVKHAGGRNIASLADTIGDALSQALKMHLVISDLRVYYWMTVALGLSMGTMCAASIAYGLAWLSLDAPELAGLDPYVMILGGSAMLIPTVFMTFHRMSTYSTLLRTMRTEVAVLEKATEKARAEAESMDLVGA